MDVEEESVSGHSVAAKAYYPYYFYSKKAFLVLTGLWRAMARRAGRPCAKTKVDNWAGSTVPPLAVLDPSLARVWRAGVHALTGSSGLD